MVDDYQRSVAVSGVQKGICSSSDPSLAVDSDEIPPGDAGSETLFQQLLRRMNPAECLLPASEAMQSCSNVAYKSCLASDREEFDLIMAGLLSDIRRAHKLRSPALQRLYRLTDREHAANRVAAVCTTSFETVQVLLLCLKSTASGPDRRQALLIINNLCIPDENKSVILFGEPCAPLLNSLLSLIRNRAAESYLATVALLNLSYLQDDHAKATLHNFVAARDSNSEAASSYGYQLPCEDPYSTIRILESMLKDFVLYVSRKVNSVEHQCCRWSMNFVRNLASVPDIALSMGTTTVIPTLAVRCLSYSDTTNLQTWTRDSLEDACLMLLVHVCAHDDVASSLHRNKPVLDQLMAICRELEKVQGIHRTRAVALRNRLDELESLQSIGFSV